MPDTNKESALYSCERLRRAVERFYIDDASLPADKKLTISLGLASFPNDADTKEDLVNRADIALYEAKRTGKNRTCLYRREFG